MWVDWRGEIASQCNLDPEGKPSIRRVYLSHRTNVNVTALRRKAFWQLEAKEYQKVTLHNKRHTRDLLGKETQEGGCFCLARETAEN